ncbi:ATP-binding cassette sub-family A member 3 [Caerostris extrusa]|uniref:ATP-binding cassette sub-family A member 3 n=1 Tax=Caerostris extrusa TaxID=172846 RepID=A0AAV4WEZ0_CAEEX|nr:ATP-binding cassette sub-family A member 3 [Caerostris extrusa]
MDECEALSSQIDMMVGADWCLWAPWPDWHDGGGRLVFVGSLSELKRQCGEGYSLHVELSHRNQIHRGMTSRTTAEEAKIWIEGWFPEAKLKVDFPNSLFYYIPHRDVEWATFFLSMEKARHQKLIHDFSISDPSLDHILFFASTEDNVQERMITEYLHERMK